jgi:hypothetical protein
MNMVVWAADGFDDGVLLTDPWAGGQPRLRARRPFWANENFAAHVIYNCMTTSISIGVKEARRVGQPSERAVAYALASPVT